MSLQNELRTNYRKFREASRTERNEVESKLEESQEIFLESYKFLASINSWRVLLLKPEISENAYNFFVEAHNDAVSSHAFAQMGSWRAALKFLRSCIENILACEYYKDHPVELSLWAEGRHRISFTDLTSYFQKHPDISSLEDDFASLGDIQKEYSTLSRAVHGSATSFRMTGGHQNTNLWISDKAKLGSWHTRERRTLTSLNFFLIALHQKELQGARLPGLRNAISLVLRSEGYRQKVREQTNINLPASENSKDED